MNKYWSHTKLSDLIRGTAILKCGTSKEWNQWHLDAKAAHPIRYWITESFIDTLQNVVTWPGKQLSNIHHYINNRWLVKSHQLTASKIDIKPGEWRCVSNRILPCLFNELVNFVEVELAWMHVWCYDDGRVKYNVPHFDLFSKWRSAQAGIEHLEWASKLTCGESYSLDKSDPKYNTHTQQATNAIETLKLYRWWTEVYRNRKDSMDISGWTDYCDKRAADGDDFLSMLTARSEEDRLLSREIHNRMNNIDIAYETEDTEMLCRLIKIRQSLST